MTRVMFDLGDVAREGAAAEAGRHHRVDMHGPWKLPDNVADLLGVFRVLGAGGEEVLHEDLLGDHRALDLAFGPHLSASSFDIITQAQRGRQRRRGAQGGRGAQARRKDFTEKSPHSVSLSLVSVHLKSPSMDETKQESAGYNISSSLRHSLSEGRPRGGDVLEHHRFLAAVILPELPQEHAGERARHISLKARRRYRLGRADFVAIDALDRPFRLTMRPKRLHVSQRCPCPCNGLGSACGTSGTVS